MHQPHALRGLQDLRGRPQKKWANTMPPTHTVMDRTWTSFKAL
jgi:hypothetical protein